MQLDARRLLEACGDDALVGGIRIHAALEPLGGPGAPTKPASYAGARFQQDERWVGEGADRRKARVIVVDNVPSQANRLEAALERLAPEIGLPTVMLDLSGLEPLPPHLPRQLSGLRFPHRQADAYLRDAVLDGMPFPKTEIGRRILDATADTPDALFEWFPQALLFGFWQSHLGKKRSQAKLARSWVSEVVGIEPAADEPTRTLGVKGDPLNLSVDEKVVFDADDLTAWSFAAGERKEGGQKKRESLSEIGHGQVPFRSGEEALAPVSFSAIEQRSVLSFAGLRRIWCGDSERNAAGRALLAALGLLAHVDAFGRPFTLRSSCDLRPTTINWRWLDGSDDEVEPLTREQALTLARDCIERAEAAGLPVGSHWRRELRLAPGPDLAKVIRSTYPAPED